jgi:hypothetical protein
MQLEEASGMRTVPHALMPLTSIFELHYELRQGLISVALCIWGALPPSV